MKIGFEFDFRMFVTVKYGVRLVVLEIKVLV